MPQLHNIRQYGKVHPNEPISVNWSDPLCRNLQSAITQNGGQIYDYASKRTPAGGSGTRTSTGGKYGRMRVLDSGSDFFTTKTDLDNVTSTGYTVLVWGLWRNYTNWNYSGIFSKTSDFTTGESFQTWKGAGTGVDADMFVGHGFAGNAITYSASEVQSGEPLCWSWDGSDVQPWVGATKKSAVALTASPATTAGYIKVGSNRDTHDSEGDHYLTLVWDRVLTDAEIQALIERPFRVFKPANDILFNASAASGYTLTADSGSFVLSGTAASLIADRSLDAESSSYTLSGTDADLLLGRTLTADSGTFNLSGTDASLLISRLLDSASGTFTLSGTDAGLTYTPTSGAYTLVAESGAYTFTGTAADLLAARTLSADTVAFTFNGTSADLNTGFSLTAESGSYTLTGTAVDFSKTSVLAGDSAAYVLTGSNATLRYSGGASWTVQSDSSATWTEQTNNTTNWTIQ